MHTQEKQLKSEILEKTGIPPLFASLLEEKSKTLGIALAIRTSSPFQRYLMPASPKPSSVKLKTGNWGLTKGVISVDPLLGKIEKKDNAWCLQERSHEEIHLDIIQTVLHRVSLQEILAALHNQSLTLLNSEKEIRASGKLILKPGSKAPANCGILFSINLLEQAPRRQPQQQIDIEKFQTTTIHTDTEPTWWNNLWGSFRQCLTHYYPALYRQANDSEFQDILIYGVSNGEGEVLPITGDQDLLWISEPANRRETLLKNFENIIDTSSPEGCRKLYEARIELYLKLGGNPEEAEKTISNDSIAGLGHVTPFESYVIDEINKSFYQSGVKHLRNLIQHAAENHNPGEPSRIDAPMVHVRQGKLLMTHNERELINYVMQGNYYQENIIQVHPKWDMGKWSPLIEKQLLLKQPIMEDTIVAFNEYRAKRKSVTYFWHGGRSK